MTALTLSLTPQQLVQVVFFFLRKDYFYLKYIILQLKHDDSLYPSVKYWHSPEGFGKCPTFVLTHSSLKVSRS